MVAALPVGELRPTDDELWDQTLRDRDRYHDMADDLAAQIAAITGEDIGEHSSANDPWRNAMLSADDFIANQLRNLLAAASSQPVREPLPDQSNLATIAGLEASTGHLSAMVDELRALLGRALANFTTLHNAAKPDEDGPDIDAIIPGGVFARFVDEDAAIRYALNQTCHHDMIPAANGITKKGAPGAAKEQTP